MALVDVLMPAYNAAATIGEAIESLRNQSLTDIRIIVVNDGSTDDTAKILAGLAEADSRIVVISQPNRGGVEARNEGLRHCTADYIACLDADDTASPGRLEHQLDTMQAHPECVALGGAVEHIDADGAPLSGLVQPGPPSQANPAKAPALEPYIVHSTLMVRRADIAALGGYRHVPNSEDSDLFWRLAERGELFNLPQIFAKYRVHVASVSSSLVSGRVMAVGSQLGALSALRRRVGKADLDFSLELLATLKGAETLAGMTALAARGLSDEEAKHLSLAAGAKLMEMAQYRPYELEASDCTFIRAALAHASSLTPENQKEIAWYVTTTGARLMRKGLWREALALTPPQHLPVAAARLLLAR